jgi:hypothetical protein
MASKKSIHQGKQMCFIIFGQLLYVSNAFYNIPLPFARVGVGVGAFAVAVSYDL